MPALLFLSDFLLCGLKAQRGMLGLSQPDVELVVGKHIMNKPCGKAVQNMETQKAEGTCISSLITGLQSHCALQSL